MLIKGDMLELKINPNVRVAVDATRILEHQMQGLAFIAPAEPRCHQEDIAVGPNIDLNLGATSLRHSEG